MNRFNRSPAARRLALVAFTLCACGPGSPTEPPPSDWMLGEFSATKTEGEVRNDLDRIEIRADGVARFQSVFVCCGMCNNLSDATEVAWERDGEHAILVWLYGVDEPDHLRIEYGDCNTITVHTVSDGAALGSREMHRGAMCLTDRPCEGVECDPCQTAWCEGEAPSGCDSGS